MKSEPKEKLQVTQARRFANSLGKHAHEAGQAVDASISISSSSGSAPHEEDAAGLAFHLLDQGGQELPIVLDRHPHCYLHGAISDTVRHLPGLGLAWPPNTPSRDARKLKRLGFSAQRPPIAYWKGWCRLQDSNL